MAATSKQMKQIVVCNHVATKFGEHWEVWIDGKDLEDIRFKDFTLESEAQQYAQDLANEKNLEVVYP
jgi:hypothetical protein